MNKRIVWSIFGAFVVFIIILFGMEESRTFFLALGLRIFLFVKHNILALLTAFFLVKGKFILSIFLKKIAILSATGLGKRYMIEKVINHNLKIHFLDHISDDIKRLVQYTKEHFIDFPIIKQIIAVLVFLGSLGFVGKFMGSMLAMKVFIAKFWSFLLVLVLKFSTAVVYFFTDYLWSLWISPLIEILIFSWIFDLMERVPFLKKYLSKMYRFFIILFEWLEVFMEKVFHIPVKRFFKLLAKRIKKTIYTFIDYKRVSAWKRLEEVRELSPNKHSLLVEKRQVSKQKKEFFSARERLIQKRKHRLASSS